jgi:hypothetical protein
MFRPGDEEDPTAGAGGPTNGDHPALGVWTDASTATRQVRVWLRCPRALTRQRHLHQQQQQPELRNRQPMSTSTLS